MQIILLFDENVGMRSIGSQRFDTTEFDVSVDIFSAAITWCSIYSQLNI